jgi:hypothetical protein
MRERQCNLLRLSHLNDPFPKAALLEGNSDEHAAVFDLEQKVGFLHLL